MHIFHMTAIFMQRGSHGGIRVGGVVLPDRVGAWIVPGRPVVAPLRACTKCGKKRPESEYFHAANGKARPVCKRCEVEARKERRARAADTDATAVVPVDDTNAPPLPAGGVASAIASDAGELPVLEALRDRLAREIDAPTTLARDLSPLVNRLQDVLFRVEAVKAQIAADELEEAARAEAGNDEWDAAAI